MPSEFSISESPIGDTLSGAAVFGPSYQFDSTSIKYRYGERYASEATNRKFLGVPLGVYLGFLPSFSNNILTLSVDPEFDYSLARLASIDDPLYIVDVIVEDDATLDFSNHNVFPVNVVLRARGKLGFPHGAEIVTQTAAPNYPTEILIGVVTGPNAIDVSEPFNRTTPYAYSGTPLGYGFMKSNAVEELLAAIAVNAEVAAARTDLSGFTHPDLDTRLETDASASAMAERLGKEIITFQAGDFVVGVPSISINISRAFSGYHRGLLGLTPAEDFAGFASESRKGAITSGTIPDPAPTGALTDPERNVCAIINAATEARFVDSTLQVAYGRLSYSEFNLSGSEITFNGASTTVNGVGTLFTAQLEPGDIIQDPVSGSYFEVASITSDVVLDLSVPFPNATTPAATAPTVRRRYTMTALTRSGPTTESSYTLPISTVRVYFNAWRSIDVSEYDHRVRLNRYFEEPPVADATTSTLGKAINVSGLSEAKAGGIFAVRQNPPANQVGSNHIHTIDFEAASPEVAGVVSVTQRGPTGAPGLPGSGGVPGPDGAQGPQGQGLDNLLAANLFDVSNEYDHIMLGPGAMYSYTTTLTGGTKILFLTGGNCSWYQNAFQMDVGDYFDILDIRETGGLGVALDGRVGTETIFVYGIFRFYFNASVT